MPDTGAPWNIPYVEAADLVSDWPADSLLLANAIDAGLDAAGNAGIGSNVVQAHKSGVFSTSSTTFVDVTGLSLSFTPTTATSKVLLLAVISVSKDGTTAGSSVAQVRLVRDASAINVGNAASSRTQAFGVNVLQATTGYNIDNIGTVFVDSPATTSAVTYALQIRSESGSVGVNRNDNDSGSTDRTRTASSLIAIEVAA